MALLQNSAFSALASQASGVVAQPEESTLEAKAKDVVWRSKLKPAGFRGVAFFVESDELDTGRRTQTHEFAGRDIPYTEDLGRKARTYSVEGYVLGSGYMAARDALIEACEKEGPGPLIVPWMPERQVNCTGCKKKESQAEGGIARFSLTFAEAGQAATPTATALPGTVVGAKTDEVMDALGKVLDKSVTVAGVPIPVSVDTLEAMKGLGSQISGASSILRMGADIPSALSALANLTPADLAGLLPSELCGPLFSLAESYTALSAAFSSQHAARSSALLSLAASTPSVSVPSGAGLVRTTVAQNRAALAEYQRSAAVAEAARSATLSIPASRQEASTRRDQVVDAIDGVLETTREPEVFESFAALRASTVRAMAELAGSAPEVATVRTSAVQPSLVLAQRINPDASAPSEESMLLTRNRVRHPGFVPPGQLEVLRA